MTVVMPVTVLESVRKNTELVRLSLLRSRGFWLSFSAQVQVRSVTEAHEFLVERAEIFKQWTYDGFSSIFDKCSARGVLGSSLSVTVTVRSNAHEKVSHRIRLGVKSKFSGESIT